MSGEAGQTTEVGAGADVEMSEDSGYPGSRNSATSGKTSTADMLSQSGDSTATLIESEQTAVRPDHTQGQLDSGCASLASDVGQRSSSSQTATSLPIVAEDTTARTEKWVNDSFEVFVKTLEGKTLTITVDDKYEEVSVFKERVRQKVGMPVKQQYLLSQEGKALQDGQSLCDYNIKKHSTVYCQGRLRGGQP